MVPPLMMEPPVVAGSVAVANGTSGGVSSKQSVSSSMGPGRSRQPANRNPQPVSKIALGKPAEENESGKSTPVISNIIVQDEALVPSRKIDAKLDGVNNENNDAAAIIASSSNMSRLMNDLQRTEREKKEALEQVNKLKTLLGSSAMNNKQKQQSSMKEEQRQNQLQGQSGLLDNFKEMVATQGESAAVAWISKQLEASDNSTKSSSISSSSPGKSRGVIHGSEDLLLSSVIPPLTPRSRPGSRAASPERGGGGGLLLSQSLGQNLNHHHDQGRGKRMMTPLPRQLHKTGTTNNNSGGENKQGGIASSGNGVVSSFQESSSIEHEYLVAAAKSIPNEYGTQLASYLVRRPYIDLQGDAIYSYAHLTAKHDYLQNGTAFDPNSLEILAYIEADGSVFTLTNRCNARHGKQSSSSSSSSSSGKTKTEDDLVDWAIFDNVEEMDRALGKVTYIDVEGNEREYWLDSIYEEALTTRESYCMSMISAAFALKEVTGSMSGAAQSFQNVGGANNTNTMQQPPSQNNFSSNNNDVPMQHEQQPPPMQSFQPSNQMMQDGIRHNLTPPMNEGNIAQQSMQTRMPNNPQPDSSKSGEPTALPKESSQQPSSKGKQSQSQPQPDEKQATANKTMPPKEEEYEPADSALPFMVISLFSLLFSFLWFFVKIPFKIGSSLFTFWVLVVALRLVWLFFADDNGAWEMGAGVDYEYNMPGIY